MCYRLRKGLCGRINIDNLAEHTHIWFGEAYVYFLFLNLADNVLFGRVFGLGLIQNK